MGLKRNFLILLFLGIQLWATPIFANANDAFLDEIERSILRLEYDGIHNYLDSLEIIKSEFRPDQELRSLWLLASYYYKNRIFDRSFELVNELRKKAEINNDSLYIGLALYRTGTIYSDIGQREMYLDYIGRAKGIATSTGDLNTQARCTMGAYNVLLAKREIGFEALKNGYGACFDLIKNLKGDYAYDTQLAILFNLFEAYEKYDRDYYQVIKDILSLSQKAQRKDTYAAGMYRLHKYHILKKDTISALNALEEAQIFASKINNNVILYELSFAFARIYKDRNLPDKAFDFAMKANTYNKLTTEGLDQAGRNALSRYIEIDELSSKNKELIQSNILASINNSNLKKINQGIAVFAAFLLSSFFFWVQQYKQKNKNKLIMAEQQAQLWSARFNSAEKDKQMDLLTSFQEGQEIIRNRIAMVLHDKIAGGIAGVKLFLSNDPALPKSKISPILEQLDDLYDYSRNLSHFYYDPLPADIEFCDLVKKKIHQSSYNTGMQLECILYPEEKINSLSPLIKTEILRYISELIRNIEIHSKATQGELTITLQEDGLYVTVVDNGVGKSSDNLNSEGIGLQIIKKRLALLNGEIEISSQLTKGYTCIIFIPKEIINNTEHAKTYV